MKDGQLFRVKVIKDESDLPKSERTMYFVGVKDNLHPEDLYEWFDYKNPVMANNQAEYWINTFEWYLEPIEITDADIEAWARDKLGSDVYEYYLGLMTGAKSMRDGLIGKGK